MLSSMVLVHHCSTIRLSFKIYNNYQKKSKYWLVLIITRRNIVSIFSGSRLIEFGYHFLTPPDVKSIVADDIGISGSVIDDVEMPCQPYQEYVLHNYPWYFVNHNTKRKICQFDDGFLIYHGHMAKLRFYLNTYIIFGKFKKARSYIFIYITTDPSLTHQQPRTLIQPPQLDPESQRKNLKTHHQWTTVQSKPRKAQY